MSSGDKKNLLKAENGFIRFGSNFEELLPGYQSPVHYSDINLTIVHNAIQRRQDLNELDHEAATYDPEAQYEHDHVLSFFKRTIQRIAPEIQEARKKREEKEKTDAIEEMSKGLTASDEVLYEELNGLIAKDFALSVETSQLAIADIFTDDELAAIARQLERDKMDKLEAERLNSPETDPDQSRSS